MNGKDFAIGILSVTAVVLFAALVIVQAFAPTTAMAIGQSASAGDLIAATSQMDEVSDMLVIVDTTAQKVNYYYFDPVLNTLQPIQQVDLRAVQREGGVPRPRRR
jgi:hypothetical protein